jgi:hypothetical protein
MAPTIICLLCDQTPEREAAIRDHVSEKVV